MRCTHGPQATFVAAALSVATLAACADSTPLPTAAHSHLSPAQVSFEAQPVIACAVFYEPVTVLDAPDGAAADLNGNGWICQRSASASTVLAPFLDDSNTQCPPHAVRTLNPGDPLDENGNGHVCQVDGVTIRDDHTDVACDCGDGGGSKPEIICPAGYDPQLALGPIGGPIGGPGGPGLPAPHPDDDNGNGWICTNGTDTVDDIVGSPPPTLSLTAGKVNGHGVYDAAGGTLSFSFHANSDGASVKGNFEFHDRATGGRFHGEVTCLEVDGMTALLEGVVSDSRSAAPAVGSIVTWAATDNGEGKKSPPDEVSAPESRDPEPDFTPCGLAPTGTGIQIDGGNVQVR